jgi:hypothetical protein
MNSNIGGIRTGEDKELSSNCQEHKMSPKFPSGNVCKKLDR